jgi:hypothetical protein
MDTEEQDDSNVRWNYACAYHRTEFLMKTRQCLIPSFGQLLVEAESVHFRLADLTELLEHMIESRQLTAGEEIFYLLEILRGDSVTSVDLAKFLRRQALNSLTV